MRNLGIVLLLAFAVPLSAQNNPVSTVAVTSTTSSTSNIRVATPNELVVINGRVMRVADLVAVLSSLDSLEVQRLHSPEMRNRESNQPVAPAQKPNPKCAAGVDSPVGAAGQQPVPSCAPVESETPNPESNHPR